MIGQANPQAIILDCEGDLTRNDSQRRFLAQHSVENIATIRNNVATMLQRCVALKIVVANRLV